MHTASPPQALSRGTEKKGVHQAVVGPGTQHWRQPHALAQLPVEDGTMGGQAAVTSVAGPPFLVSVLLAAKRRRSTGSSISSALSTPRLRMFKKRG